MEIVHVGETNYKNIEGYMTRKEEVGLRVVIR